MLLPRWQRSSDQAWGKPLSLSRLIAARGILDPAEDRLRRGADPLLGSPSALPSRFSRRPGDAPYECGACTRDKRWATTRSMRDKACEWLSGADITLGSARTCNGSLKEERMGVSGSPPPVIPASNAAGLITIFGYPKIPRGTMWPGSNPCQAVWDAHNRLGPLHLK